MHFFWVAICDYWALGPLGFRDPRDIRAKSEEAMYAPQKKAFGIVGARRKDLI